MPTLDLVLRAHRMVGPDGEVAAAVGVAGGMVVAVEPLDADLAGAREVELAEDEVLLPGLVDSHVHVNEPGRTDWEGFASATRAAAAGGVTTIVDMPLNSVPPTTDVAALRLKRKTAQPQVYVDVGFWGGAVPSNLTDLAGLHEAGAFGFKCFLLDSGVEEFPALDPAALERVMTEVRRFDGLLLVHAEDPAVIADAARRTSPGPAGRYADFVASRPDEAETGAVTRVVEMAGRTGCRVHIVHVSSAATLPVLAAARAQGVRITAETCPHYLALAAEDVPDGDTAFKCCPPIRGRANRNQLWDGLTAGLVDLVVSDHSPCPVDLKRLDFASAWGGIASLQLGLPVVWTAARSRGLGLDAVVRWMCQGPARLVGLRRKGEIALGHDADFCVFAPDEEVVVDVRRLRHRHPLTPYAGQMLTGAVRSTWLRGAPVDIDAEPRGRLLERGDA